MRTFRAEAGLLALPLLLGASARAAEPRNVKVVIQFQSVSTGRVQAARPSGGVTVTERGGRGRLTVEDSSTGIRQSTSLFTVVQEGQEGRLVVATAVPYPQVAFLYDYATARGYLATGIQLQQVGTSLAVRPTILPDGSIRVRLTPHLTFQTATGGGDVEFLEATTEVRARNGVPVPLGGAGRQLDKVTRRILGAGATRAADEVTLVLIVSIQ